jgi:hypothetical protein
MLAVTGLASAQVQKCIDNNGRALYTEGPCPSYATRVTSLKSPAPSNGAAPTKQKDWAAENEAFNKRQAQREHNQMVENNNRAAINAFNNASNKPLAPGESRRVTLTLPAQ